jgi:hypothetical protein
MASEDSVEDYLLWIPSILAIPVDGVGKVNELHDSFDRAVPSLADQFDSARKDLVIGYTRRKAHIAAEERNHHGREDAAVSDLEHQHVWIPWLGKDRAGAKLLRSHLEKTSSVPVLIQKELRLD